MSMRFQNLKSFQNLKTNDSVGGYVSAIMNLVNCTAVFIVLAMSCVQTDNWWALIFQSAHAQNSNFKGIMHMHMSWFEIVRTMKTTQASLMKSLVLVSHPLTMTIPTNYGFPSADTAWKQWPVLDPFFSQPKSARKNRGKACKLPV